MQPLSRFLNPWLSFSWTTLQCRRKRVRGLVSLVVWFGTALVVWLCKLSQSQPSSIWVLGEIWGRKTRRACECTGSLSPKPHCTLKHRLIRYPHKEKSPQVYILDYNLIYLSSNFTLNLWETLRFFGVIILKTWKFQIHVFMYLNCHAMTKFQMSLHDNDKV